MIDSYAATTPAVSAGADHSLFLDSTGTVRVVGSNLYGDFGNGVYPDFNEYRIPVRVQTDVRMAAAGNFLSFFVRTDGSLWGTGRNDTGQLGDGTTEQRVIPVRILNGIRTVATGYFHNLFLGEDGTVWATGQNDQGQLGDGSKVTRTSPVQILTEVKAVAAGAKHSLMLKTDGTVWAAGGNYNQQLGGGSTAPRLMPVQILTGVRDVAAGAFHSLFLMENGTVLAAGANKDGQLGSGGADSPKAPVPVLIKWQPQEVLTGVKSIAAGDYHSIFVRDDGAALACGWNNSGQLGDGGKLRRFLPFQVLEGVTAASANFDHSLFLKSDGSVWASGNTANGKTTGGPFSDKIVPDKIMQLTPEGIHPWQREQFGDEAGNLSLSGWEADPDGDGIANLLERAFHLAPLQAGRQVVGDHANEAGLPFTFSQQKGNAAILALRYVRLKAFEEARLSYHAQFSSTPDQPESWEPGEDLEIVESIDFTWEVVTVTDRLTASPNRRFARVKVAIIP